MTLALILAVLPVRWSGLLQPIEMAAYDRMVALRGAGEGTQARVVELGITEADILRFGWPLSDGTLADLIGTLHADNPRAIGIDIFRPSPLAPGSERLDAALASTPEAVWVDRFGEGSWAGISAPTAAGSRTGFADVLLDPSGVARRGLLFLDDGKTTAQSLSLRLALLYLRAEGIRPRPDAAGNLTLGQVALPPLDAALGGYRDIDTRGYQIMREFTAPHRLRSFSLGDLMDGKVPRETVENRVVVVGIVSDSVRDIVMAPISTAGPHPLPGVTLHGLFAAELIAHGLDGAPSTYPLSRWPEFLLLLATMIAGGLIGTFAGRVYWVVLALTAGTASIAGGAYFAFVHAIWLPAFLLAACWVLAIVLSKTATAQMEASQRTFLMKLFSTHMSAPIAAEMWNRRHDFVRLGRPLPVRLTATVLFSDVNDFTTISEEMEPEAIVAWLEPYMIAMCRLIERHGGVVERFSGDGILAMFGVPVKHDKPEEIVADAVAAVRCAREMARAIGPLNAGYRAAGQPEIRFAIGIQSGNLVGCCLGSAERQQYTTMGDTTNTAARLVNVAKDVMKRPGVLDACSVVIGGATRDLIGGSFPVHPLGSVDLKGKHRRTEAYEVETREHGAIEPPHRLVSPFQPLKNPVELPMNSGAVPS